MSSFAVISSFSILEKRALGGEKNISSPKQVTFVSLSESISPWQAKPGLKVEHTDDRLLKLYNTTVNYVKGSKSST